MLLQHVYIIQSIQFNLFRNFQNYETNTMKAKPNRLRFSSPQQDSSCPLIVNLFHPLPQATTNMLSVTIDFPFLDYLYQWKHVLYGLSCVASFTMFVKHSEVHPYTIYPYCSIYSLFKTRSLTTTRR